MTDLLASAWLSITRHRLRSLLAMAGVAVGVCALTSIMSVEQAWRRAVTSFFAPLDLQTVRVVMPGGVDWQEARFRRPALDRTDAEAIAREPGVDASTFVTTGMLRVEGDAGGMEMVICAVQPDFTKTLPDELKEGRLFTVEEVARQAPVCVLSFEARVQLFGPGSALNQYVRVAGRRFTVVGVIAGNRHPEMRGVGVYIPETWKRIVLQAETGENTTACLARVRDPKAAVGRIERLLRERIGGNGSQPFTHSLWQVREAALHARDRAAAYSALAGLCALLAAGIGIASLLFVSVAERSREIGILRALGASRLRVYGEYLLASALLSGGGALAGAVAAVPAAAAGVFSTRWQPVLDPLAGEFLTGGARQFPELSQIALSVSWEAVAMAVVLALLCGAAAALAPAQEAASLSPALAIAQRAGAQRSSRQVLTCLQVAFGVIVLVVLTSYYALMESEQQAEARRSFGQDTVSAVADPIVALRQPVEQRYIDACQDALADAVSAPGASARLREQNPLLADLAASAELPMSVEHGGRTLDVQVVLTVAEGLSASPGLVGAVRKHAEQAFAARQPVAVINANLRTQLFGSRDPVGRSLSVAGKQFAVIAVGPNPPGVTGPRVWYVSVPLSYYAALRPRALTREGALWGQGTRVEGRPIDPRRYVEALTQLRDTLLPMLPKEYRKGILLSEEIPETTKQFIFQSKAVAMRGAIGALAVLLVALIGLANMLLVSVHDELRETGLRRALGATRPDVFLHFLSQGILLSALGAIAGLVIGAGVCGATRSWAGLPLSVSAFWAAAGAVATVLAGTLTSAAPALIATRIHPVEALRYE